MTTTYRHRGLLPRGPAIRPVAGLTAAVGVAAALVLWGDSALTGPDAPGLSFDSVGIVPIAAAPAAEPATPIGFGASHTWSDGSTIAIFDPTPWGSSSAFAPSGLARAVSVQVTITAGALPFDPTTLRFDASAASQPAGAVFDTGSGIAPIAVPAGATENYLLLFAIPVQESTRLTIEVDRTLQSGRESVTIAGLS